MRHLTDFGWRGCELVGTTATVKMDGASTRPGPNAAPLTDEKDNGLHLWCGTDQRAAFRSAEVLFGRWDWSQAISDQRREGGRRMVWSQWYSLQAMYRFMM